MKYLLTIILFMSMSFSFAQEKQYGMDDYDPTKPYKNQGRHLLGDYLEDKLIVCIDEFIVNAQACANWAMKKGNYKVFKILQPAEKANSSTSDSHFIWLVKE